MARKKSLKQMQDAMLKAMGMPRGQAAEVFARMAAGERKPRNLAPRDIGRAAFRLVMNSGFKKPNERFLAGLADASGGKDAREFPRDTLTAVAEEGPSGHFPHWLDPHDFGVAVRVVVETWRGSGFLDEIRAGFEEARENFERK